MAEATQREDGDLITITAENSLAKGQVIQLKDGRAGYADNAINAGDEGQIRVSGVARLTKNTSIVLLEGCEVFWDHSANEVQYKTVNDRDFFVGCQVGDLGETTTSSIIDVALNERPKWTVDVARDHFLHVPVGTQGLNTMGVFRRGGGHDFLISSTSEAQKLDILSVDAFATAANAIVEFCFTVPSDGAGTVVDINVGIANGTNATDADSITNQLFMHLDANNTNINFQSKDGTTTVASTDSTLDYVEGSAVANRVYVVMDMRNPADVQIYVNGANVLPSTVFDVSAATGPWQLLAHIEKTSAADTYQFSLHSLRARIMEQ